MTEKKNLNFDEKLKLSDYIRDNIEKVKNLLTSMTQAQLASHLSLQLETGNIPPSTLTKILKHHGVAVRKRGPDRAFITVTRWLAENGHADLAIDVGKAFGLKDRELQEA